MSFVYSEGVIVRVDPIKGFGFIRIHGKNGGANAHFQTSSVNRSEFDLTSDLTGFLVKFRCFKTRTGFVAKDIRYLAHPASSKKIRMKTSDASNEVASTSDRVLKHATRSGANKLINALTFSSKKLKMLSLSLSPDQNQDSGVAVREVASFAK